MCVSAEICVKYMHTFDIIHMHRDKQADRQRRKKRVTDEL